MPCYSPLKGYKDRYSGGLTFKRSQTTAGKMEVACGQCVGCRLDRSRMWAMRIVHESSLHELDGGNCFVTLTYRDKSECTDQELERELHIPDDWSLCLSHFQKFMKRLRKTREQSIRFYHVGEYGDRCKHCPPGLEVTVDDCALCNVGRPHYHACLFNCSFTDLEAVGQRNGVVHYSSPELESIWKYGFVQVGELNFESAAYVARYCVKKINGLRAGDHYLNMDQDGVVTFVAPEYSTMSRRPGIGRGWYERFKDDLFPSDQTPVPGQGVIHGTPRYYGSLLEVEDPDTFAEVKRLRESFMRAHAADYTPERLMDRYKVKKAQLDQLKRGLS